MQQSPIVVRLFCDEVKLILKFQIILIILFRHKMGDGEVKIDLNSRVFVANIPSDQIDKEELRERFAKYGFVKGIV